jgi:hypothetical protein
VVHKALIWWLPLVVAVTGLAGLVYLAVQQDYRMSANDPQIQMAEEAASALSGGASPASLVGSSTVDIEHSLAPFLVVYSKFRAPVASSARLGGRIPVPPAGVFDYTNEHGEDRFTWQPRRGLRYATVLAAVGVPPSDVTGFVFAGRSLREVEARIDILGLQVGAAWLVTIVATFVAALLAATRAPSEEGDADG